MKTFQSARAHQVGGTLHVSLGQMSGAGTALQHERGISDDAQAHLDDIVRINRGTGRRDILERTVPLQGETIDWLMSLGFDMDPSCPVVLHLHEAYRTARTYWGRQGGLSVLQAIAPVFEAAMSRPNARLLTGHRALHLVVEGGRVSGIVVESAAGEQHTLQSHAAACRGERPDAMGRVHCPRPIEGPVFRAVRMHGMVLKTPAGVRVNDSMQACRADGTAIEGLHVIGEAIGGSTLSGQGFVSGMSVTPSLTLGRWLGRDLGQRLSLSRAA